MNNSKDNNSYDNINDDNSDNDKSVNGVSVDGAADRDNHNDGNGKNTGDVRVTTYGCVHVIIVVVGIE